MVFDGKGFPVVLEQLQMLMSVSNIDTVENFTVIVPFYDNFLKSFLTYKNCTFYFTGQKNIKEMYIKDNVKEKINILCFNCIEYDETYFETLLRYNKVSELKNIALDIYKKVNSGSISFVYTPEYINILASGIVFENYAFFDLYNQNSSENSSFLFGDVKKPVIRIGGNNIMIVDEKNFTKKKLIY